MQEAQARPFKQTLLWAFPDVWVIFKILPIHGPILQYHL